MASMSDKTYTMPDNPDPKFYRDALIKLFAPREYDNPEGRKILGDEFDKSFEEMKKKINDFVLDDTDVSSAQLDVLKDFKKDIGL